MFRSIMGAAGLVTLLSVSPAHADDLSQGATFHGDPGRSGHFVASGLTWASAATMHRDTSFQATTTGNINVQPLYWRASIASHGMVVVATDQNMVQAFAASTGASLWRTFLGPVDTQAVPGCGLPRQQGVYGTPVIDAVHGVLYVASSTRVASGLDRYGFWAISLADGSIAPGWPLFISPALNALGFHFVSIVHDQHTALALSGGQVYAGFAANSGDCSAYHGYIVAIDATAPKLTAAWESRGGRAGVWAQGGVSSDGTSLFAATGNGTEPKGWGDGETVFRLLPGLAHVTKTSDYFVPSNFQALDIGDLDLGSSAPVPVDVPQATGGYAHWLFQIGKDGVGRVLDRANLGGIGGELADQPLAVPSEITSPAVFNEVSDTVIVLTGEGTNCPGESPQLRGVLAATLAATPTPVLQLRWCAALPGAAVPIVTTSEGASDPIVWVVTPGGDNHLHGYRGDTGAVVFDGGGQSDIVTGLPHHAAILVAEGRLFVDGADTLAAFDYTPER